MAEEKDAQQSAMQQVRSLPLSEALRLARSPDVQVRMALERCHGKMAWEPLLRNPGLSVPEVLRIVTQQNLPPGILDIVIANAAWVSNEQVRRALLGNRSIKGTEIQKVLRKLPKRELELMEKQPTWSHSVREAVRRMLRAR